MAKKKKDGRGRPPVIDEKVVQKLEQAFMIDATDEEACLFAGICRTTLHKYQKQNPEFVDRKILLKKSLTLKAKLNIAASVNKGDKPDSKWLLERRAKDEFSTKVDTDVTSAGKELSVYTENSESIIDLIFDKIKQTKGKADDS